MISRTIRREYEKFYFLVDKKVNYQISRVNDIYVCLIHCNLDVQKKNPL